MSMTYKDAGVDVHAGYEAVRLMKKHAAKTFIPGVLSGLGGFGGCFELPKGYENPVLVSGTDGVGTKLKIAFAADKHDTVGIDLVAMCVNDIICQGAKPLFFLDYIGTGKLNPPVAAGLVKGISDGCVQAGCALIGGETAELPGMYAPGEYDLAGFAVGIVEKEKMITGKNIKTGDVLIGIASSGIHSNGFSLARQLLKDSFEKSVAEMLLTPTKIYVKTLLDLISRFDIKGAANITGGGWIENIPRLAGERDDIKFILQTKSVPDMPVFTQIQQCTELDKKEMYNTFNMGVGMVLAVASSQAKNIVHAIHEMGEAAHLIGAVEKRAAGEEPIVLV